MLGFAVAAEVLSVPTSALSEADHAAAVAQWNAHVQDVIRADEAAWQRSGSVVPGAATPGGVGDLLRRYQTALVIGAGALVLLAWTKGRR